MTDRVDGDEWLELRERAAPFLTQSPLPAPPEPELTPTQQIAEWGKLRADAQPFLEGLPDRRHDGPVASDDAPGSGDAADE